VKLFGERSAVTVFVWRNYKERQTPMKKQSKGMILAAVMMGAAAPFLIAFCVSSVLKDSEQRARQEIAVEQRENVEAIKNHHALIGMSAAQVRQSWGEPTRVVRTLDADHSYEQWIYGRNGGASLYFVDGVFKSGTRSDGK